jgi:hypothetical protein
LAEKSECESWFVGQSAENATTSLEITVFKMICDIDTHENFEDIGLVSSQILLKNNLRFLHNLVYFDKNYQLPCFIYIFLHFDIFINYLMASFLKLAPFGNICNFLI